jgi:hypothetical protein
VVVPNVGPVIWLHRRSGLRMIGENTGVSGLSESNQVPKASFSTRS